MRSLQAQPLLSACCALEFSGTASGLAVTGVTIWSRPNQQKRSDTPSLDPFVKGIVHAQREGESSRSLVTGTGR
jgi:hypothetical protein